MARRPVRRDGCRRPQPRRNLDGQVKEIFRQFDVVLRRAGGSVTDMVTTTVFINDPRNGERFVKLRRGYFPEGRFPAASLISVPNFAVAGAVIEIEAVAVIGDRCANPAPCSPK